jgi:branched-chain amino acid transport system permease protein
MLEKSSLANLLRNKKLMIILVGLVLLASIPAFIGGPFGLRILTLIAVFTIYASSWNLLAYSGQGSLGHALFLGIGGFASSLIAVNLGVPPILGLLIGSLFAAGIGLLIGLACVRLKAWFLAMVTFGASVIAVAAISALDEYTHAILGFPPPPMAQSGYQLYLLTLFITALSVFSIYLIMNSKLGLAFKAIRENDLEAKMIGIHVTKYKLLAFVISTFFAGVAGALYVQTQNYVDSSIFSADNSFKALMMAVIGGLWTIAGPIIGSVVIVAIDSFTPSIDKFLQPVLHPLFPAVSAVSPPLRMLGLGLFLIIVVIFLPRGLVSLYPKIIAFFREEPKVKANDKK